MSTPFLRVRPWNFAHVFSVPLPSLSRMLLFFFPRQIFVFFGYLGLKKPHIFGEWNKRPKKNRVKSRQGNIKHVCKFSVSTLKNGVDIWTFVRLSAKSQLGNVITWFLYTTYIQFRALKLTSYWSYAVNSSIFCAKLSTNMPWSTWKRLVKKKNGTFFFFLQQLSAYQYLTSWRSVIGWDTFSVLAPVLDP